MLLGIRQYLNARDLGNGRDFRRFRLDGITSAKITGQSFARDPDFDLDTYAAQCFGSYHSDLEYRPVVWRFASGAAAAACEFAFHPDQVVTEEPDGALRVAFTASGWVEMAWHLYQRGDKVEVVAPAELRDLLMGHQRGGCEGVAVRGGAKRAGYPNDRHPCNGRKSRNYLQHSARRNSA